MILVGLCIYTFVVVTFRFPLADVGILVALVGMLLKPRQFRMPSPFWVYLLFVFWAYLGSLVSPYPAVAGAQVVEQLKLCVVILIVVNALRTPRHLHIYLAFYLLCFMVYPGRGTILNYLAGYDTFGRAIGNQLYTNPNDLAALCLFALGVSLGFMSARPLRLPVRLIGAACAASLLVVILLTQSRGAVLGLAAGFGPSLLFWGLKRPVRFGIGAAVVAVGILAVVPGSAWERFAGIKQLADRDTIAQADPEGSAAERFEILQTAARIFADHPIVGVGLGAYPEANAVYAPHLGRKDTHNTYMRLLAETGIFGLLIWIWLMASVLLYSRRSRPRDGRTDVGPWIDRGIVAYLVAALFGSYTHLTFPYMMLAVAWCAATVVRNQSAAVAQPVNSLKEA